MLNRNAMLQEQATAIQVQLTEWAAQQHILEPGEQIVFTLAIRSFPTVTRGQAEVPEEFMDMKVSEFFAEKRLQDAGVEVQTYLVAIRNRTKTERDHPELSTVRDIVAAGKSGLRKRPYVGRKTIDAIEKVLAHNGIVLPE